ncbi:hypothetical protein BDN72DRAFT_905976 [Pluteus cervinus]|uniref:Uncharacterized protein n=1 Tax=Pluteus cervinus TaxID=181527 RepID=A0ACD3A0T8_9AGAR|nr:hypothetical protein BDN72DRAFT_905976 [Pluteus cervinus]
MVSHAIAFEAPTARIYSELPPHREEMDQVFAILFTGPAQPTDEDFARTPLLVRRKKVIQALQWLKLNHKDYVDVGISQSNMEEYPEDTPPVAVVYKQSESNKIPEAQDLADNEEEDGVESGDCPFVVHGLSGEAMVTKTAETLKGIALKHLNSEGKMLAIGHNEEPESIYKNPSLYPQMFPWLFPYGYGGIGGKREVPISEKEHKRHLLMYYDKRFQTDMFFPFVAFSHEQIKATQTGGYLITEKANFQQMSQRLLNLDMLALNNLADRLAAGEVVHADTEEEKECYQVIKDLDHIGSHVQGSTTSKKYMRNEIWSLIAAKGAPSWFITLSPADIKHPICIYYADTQTFFKPKVLSHPERFRLISGNPVAAARFFHLMVTLFIQHILGVGTDHLGIYGQTAAYYGTVEQQGEFLTGTQEQVVERFAQEEKNTERVPKYENPVETLPLPPPETCTIKCGTCDLCQSYNTWYTYYLNTTDDLISKSNIHKCASTTNKDGTQNQGKQYRGCMDNKWGKCRARFPRELVQKTYVDEETGGLVLRKTEQWINTLTPVVTYLLRCNKDVTSLKSGTAAKGIVKYTTDYVTKSSLKTHVIFDTIRSMFERHHNFITGDEPSQEKAKSLMTKIVNNLTSKMEIGSPMASLYLLGNPDHYTSHLFAPFYWQSYVHEVGKSWPEDGDSGLFNEKVTLFKKGKKILGLSTVNDYVFRPKELEQMNLYEFISQCKRIKLDLPKSKGKSLQTNNQNGDETEALDEDDKECIKEEFEVELCKTTLTVSIDKTSSLQDLKKAKTYKFLEGHPFHNSQGIRLLTMFKPWRTGKDLKQTVENWDQTFSNHRFSLDQMTILKNLNIKYECLDARDDYFAQLRSGGTTVPIEEREGDNLDCDEGYEDSEIPQDVMDEVQQDQNIDLMLYEKDINTAEAIRQTYIKAIKGLMKDNEWMIPKTNLLLKVPSENVSAEVDWKNEVRKSKQEVLDTRLKEVAASLSQNKKCDIQPKSGQVNVVKVIDKSYLEKRFQSPEYQEKAADVIVEFKLNAEQERAFRIVANHAMSPYADQLRMYLGGGSMSSFLWLLQELQQP